jgi:predicted dehydrogenase
MRFIQIGVGGFGQTWLGRIQRDHSASLAALVDVNAEALEAARRETRLPGSHCHEDYAAALDEVKADAVLIVTPPEFHHEIALAALGRGLHVLTEKPMADTMEHARLMVKAAEEAGRTLMVSQNYRFRPWARTLADLMRSGKFGAPDSISVKFAKCLRADGAPDKKLRHALVRDMSVHHFDLMRSLTGREPVWVFGKTWQPQWSWFEQDACAAAIMEFEGGLKVMYEGDWVTRGRETTWDGYWCVECQQAVIELRGERLHVTPMGHADQDMELALHAEAGTGQTAVLQEFQRAVAEGREPETDGRDNLKSLAMCFALMESSRTGQRVEAGEV